MIHMAFREFVTDFLIIWGALSFARTLAKFFWR